MILYNNNNFLLKLLTGYRIGLSSLFLQTFNTTFSKIGILNGFNLQIEISLKYLFPIIFFFKKHSLFLFKLLIDITSYEFLGSKYRYILVYSLLNIETGLRLFIKVKLQEYNTSLLSIASIFYSAN
jgi:NADH:ubiquinone oxidoreductase subunit C